MRILIAPDSYKNALSALEVATSLKAGLFKVFPEAEFEILPMADGGEGTVEALIDATQGEIVKTTVHDPLMRLVESSFGITGDGITAVIEMASASGIQLVTSEERNPWITTTFGTGELIHAALDKGCRDIILGIGGSATNDCGMGMAAALGVKFLDDDMTQVVINEGTKEKMIIDRSAIGEEIFFHNWFGRLRDICISPDGRVFLAVSNRDGRGTVQAGDDRIVELSNNSAVGIHPLAKLEFSIYPNPVSGTELSIDYNIATEGMLIIYSQDGKEVSQHILSPENRHIQIQLPETSGLYNLILSNKEGISHLKILKL